MQNTLGLEKEVRRFGNLKTNMRKEIKMKNWNQRIEFALMQTKNMVFGLWHYIIVAIAIGALIHGVVPVDFFVSLAGPDNPLAVVIVVLAGIPIYSNAAGTVPIVEALMSKGMTVGTALAFMMSITALSLPEIIILKRVLKPKLLAAFVGIVGIAIILTGVLFNLIL